MSQPEVFIIESLEFDDERADRFEGKIISQILALSGKKCEYSYIRTKRELKVLLEQFASSSYRYLHLSCHGNKTSLFTTLDPIPFTELAALIKPHLRKRRLFLSACLATNEALLLRSCQVPDAIRFLDPMRRFTLMMLLFCGPRFTT